MRRPRPVNQRVWVSIESSAQRVWVSIELSAQRVIQDAFDEAKLRDPELRRRWVG